MTPEEQKRLKAELQRALQEARTGLGHLDAAAQAELFALFEATADEIADVLASLAGGDGVIPLANLQVVMGEAGALLTALRDGQEQLIRRVLDDAAENGAGAVKRMRAAAAAGEIPASAIVAMPSPIEAARAAVEAVFNERMADGLNLSDRIWRNHLATREELLPALQQAIIEGATARDATRLAIARGEKVGEDLINQIEMARAGALGAKTKEVLASKERRAYADAARVMRTEMDRTNIETTRKAIYNAQGVAGTRFMLSPAHPRFDVCDWHAGVNLYGLGKGVYPPGKSPLPAHPNTLSYEEAVFEWELTEKDRTERDDPLAWLKQRSALEQHGVLQSEQKVQALRQGLLQEDEVTLPWRMMKDRYESQLGPT